MNIFNNFRDLPVTKMLSRILLMVTVQEGLPLMPDHSSIILIGSTVASRGGVGASIYSGCKAAVRALARGLVLQLQQRKIRVNVISPGPIATDGGACKVGRWKGS